MTMNLILWGMVFWIAPMMTYMLVNETKFKKNIILGVTLPQEAREDTEVLAVIHAFKKYSWMICGLLLLLIPLCILFSAKATFTYFCFWIALCIVLPYIPYIIFNSRLKEIKIRKGWVQEKQIIKVDTSVLKGQKWLSPVLFVPPVIVCILPALEDREMFLMYLMFAALCILFWFSYRYLYRNKAEMVDENTELTKALTAVRRYNWGVMWLITSYAMGLYCVSSWVMFKYPKWGMIMFIAITVILCVMALRIEMRTRHIQEKLTAQSGSDWYVDDDDHWLFGLIYYNPDDSRVIINNRVGINSTVNAARLPGKILMIVAGAFILATPAMGFFMDSLGRQEIVIAADEQQIEAKAGMTDYKVTLEEIQEVQLLEELPEGLVRKMGTGLDTLLKGRFYAPSTGNVIVLLDPTCEPYILITTENNTYLFGTRDSAETKALYEVLTQH
ncbi:MAG: hypothetical protein IKR11_13655 [Solobacterium sp.]|nr:hypothetical protein [Solobacterium sp.]